MPKAKEETLAEVIDKYLVARYPNTHHYWIVQNDAPNQKLVFIAKAVAVDYVDQDGQAMFGGLFLRLLPQGQRLYEPDGVLYANRQIEAWALELEELREDNYVAQFAADLDEAVLVISSYMAGAQQ